MQIVRTVSTLQMSRKAGLSFARSFSATSRRKDHYLEADAATLSKVLKKSKDEGKVVLVDFYADWCQPCKMLSPILMKLAAPDTNEKTGTGAGLDLVTVNTDEQGELAMQYKVTALPTVIAFKDGEPEDKFVGALPQPQVQAFLAKL